MVNSEKFRMLNALLTINDCPIYLWRLDEAMNLMGSTCTDVRREKLLLSVFLWGTERDVRSISPNIPVLCSNSVGFSWIVFLHEPKVQSREVYAIGPVMLDVASQEALEWKVKWSLNANTGSSDWQKDLMNMVENIAMKPLRTINEYAVMLHYCITDERIATSCVRYKNELPQSRPTASGHVDALVSYRTERVLLRMVEEGNPYYSLGLARAQSHLLVPDYTADILKNHKIHGTGFVILCIRAATAGGLSLELGSSLEEKYLKQLWDQKNVVGIESVKEMLYTNLVEMVRKNRQNPKYSVLAQSVMTYVALHVTEKLSLDMLAGCLGYTKYYMSRCFKQEVGITINDHIKQAKIEYAKVLLETTEESIDDIIEQLHFSSRSYFADTFRDVTGMSATQYRKQNLKY